MKRVEREILAALEQQPADGAFNLIVCRLGRAWWNGYRCLRSLEARGLVHIQRRPGRRARITRQPKQ